ncbi:hypothetical protein F5Y15DRAFT_426485 [Xylariaceae sp. FL0016]|nr:hypothetical protein F5Y15DRAFT_426485 [Xylariaceae sp. FL0016]
MDNHKYSSEELLGLRNIQISQGVLTRLKSNPEIEVIKAKNMAPVQSRRLKNHREDHSPSTDGEEIVFQGKKLPRQGSENMQWKYRGRSGSEVTSVEPLPAPTGLAKQQNEGFQRFFKAVVSPTHVRVTAGGRIVPNTRGSASPIGKWDKDRPGAEGPPGLTESSREAKPEALPNINNGQMMPPPMISPMFPPQPGYFQPMPLYTMQNGYPMQNPPPMPFPLHAPLEAHTGHTYRDAVNGRQNIAAGIKPDGDDVDKSKPAPIKISPPEQFDQNRPCYYNGSVFYPTMGGMPAPGYHMIPNGFYQGPGVMGYPAVMSGQQPTGMTQQQYIQQQRIPPHLAKGNVPTFGPAAGHGAPPPVVAPPQAPKSGVTPPITSIRPSEITRRQLESLKSSLKFYRDQLQYNRHQIDEKAMTYQITKVTGEIQQFEKNYRTQLGFEATHYPKHDEGVETPSRQHNMRVPSESSDHGSVRSGRTGRSVRGSGNRRFAMQQQRAHGPPRNRLAIGINASLVTNQYNNNDAFDKLEAHILKKIEAENAADPSKAKLTSSVLAPPFQPRPGAGVPRRTADEKKSSNTLVNPMESQIAHQAGYTKEYTSDQWQLSGMPQRGSWETQQSTSTYFENGSARLAGHSPYLIGTLPQGVARYGSQPIDYQYPRELTEEEKRARHVYWGRVSTKGLGLPKFDGKDFYPASPAKAEGGADMQMNSKARGIPSERLEADSEFQQRASEVDPFRASIRARRGDTKSIRSYESGQKFSKAIPIVAPDGVTQVTAKNPKGSNNDRVEDAGKSFTDLKLSPRGNPTGDLTADRKVLMAGRRALERSSNRGGNDLLHSMLKKGPTSGNVLPSAVSSTTATGYLPQYFGNAAASLTPAISSNVKSSPVRASPSAENKPVELGASQPAAEKVGENCPPSAAPPLDHDVVTRELLEHTMRDAERRGVIGSDWH